jgi:hypothetical protein
MVRFRNAKKGQKTVANLGDFFPKKENLRILGARYKVPVVKIEHIQRNITKNKV